MFALIHDLALTRGIPLLRPKRVSGIYISASTKQKFRSL